MLIEKFLKQAKEEIIMDTVLSDEFMDKVQDNFAPIESDGILPVCDHGSGDKVQCFE